MAENSYVWNGIGLGDATLAPYSDSEWANLWKLRHGVGSVFPNYGVFKGTGNGTYEGLAVTATSPASTNIEVQLGAALVNGRLYENTAVVTKAVGANASGNPRIDTVILRVDFVAQTIRLIVKQGTPAASPVHPTLQQDATYWEIPLADIAVANGFATISQSNITERQRAVHSSTLGWLPYAYPINHLIGANYDASNVGFSSNASVAVPIVLTANMLVESVTVRLVGGGLTTVIVSWAIYFQDVNDGNTGENTLRRVALTDNPSANVNPGNVTFSAIPAPIVLGPGCYWIVFKNTNSPAFNFGKTVGSGFDVGNSFLTHTNPTLGQTLNFVSGWVKQTGSVGVRLNGRVFGQTASF